jgi:hypothetical protein
MTLKWSQSRLIIIIIIIIIIIGYSLILTFMGPCVISIFQYISNKMQRYTVYFIWKLLYMFRVVPSPIIKSANNCIYNGWYLSHGYCYVML